jgi:hypothetical protein
VTSLFGDGRDGSATFIERPPDYLFDRLPGSCGVFNLPGIFPARYPAAGGWMVAGYPGNPDCRPVDLLAGQDYVGDAATFLASLQAAEGKRKWWPDELDFENFLILAWLVERLHLRVLASLPPVEYLFIGSTFFDRLFHQIACGDGADYSARLSRGAQKLAGWVRQVLENFPAQIVFLASDHGVSPEIPDHDPVGFWAARGPGLPWQDGEELTNHEVAEPLLQACLDLRPEIERLRALGYME